MEFESRPEAYTYAIWVLSKFEQRYPKFKAIPACIERVRVAFENHEQDVSGVCSFLQEANLALNSEDTALLNNLIEDINGSSYVQPLSEKFKNPLGRRAESEFAIQLLLSPTPKMMGAVSRVSQEILKVIEDLENEGRQQLLNDFLKTLEENDSPIALGTFKEVPNLVKIKKILEDNSPNALIKIMCIQYKFSSTVFRGVPIKRGVVREPVGKLAEIIDEIWDDKPLASFFQYGISQNNEQGIIYRSYIADTKMYRSSPLYTTERNRGRKGELKLTRFNQLGLMLDEVNDLERLPNFWVPDCKCQSANLRSRYVIDLIENDAVYVSGPSGMASLLLGQMEILANFENLELKQHYLTAVVAYIAGGGFHGLHEIIGPAQYALELVPGYSVVVPDPNKVAPPPNYNLFFVQQAAIDPGFNARRERAWKRHLDSFERNYAPKYLERFKETLAILDKPVENKGDESSSSTMKRP